MFEIFQIVKGMKSSVKVVIKVKCKRKFGFKCMCERQLLEKLQEIRGKKVWKNATKRKLGSQFIHSQKL